MFQIDVDYLNYKIKAAGTTQEACAAVCGCERGTLRRQLRNGKLSLDKMYALIQFLCFSEEDIRRVFFTLKGA